MIRPIAAASVPTRHGSFTCAVFDDDGTEHLALVRGELEDLVGGEPVLVRVHSECLTGDVFGSRRCDCGEQLDRALARIAEAGRGVLVYLRGHEGRGIGIGHKIVAYRLQDDGLDTVDANLAQGLPADARTYDQAAAILRHLGVLQVRLMTNNPLKCQELAEHGIEVVERIPSVTVPTPENEAYLRTKAERMGHLIDLFGRSA
ncbi:MAG TPA: GTP cyclohydrolase II [Acidimicrobiaceae bacterium]|nr:GTP cyclohydrolase II [Acidimicrobiaceae bacterium]